MKKGIIFDIKRYAVHDGPGIRTTVFFKGCPLQCVWCHNPEGISQKPELIFRKRRCLSGCRICEKACPQQAIKREETGVVIDRNSCRACGTCAAACPADALEKVGEEVSVKELVGQIEKDRVFFEESGGGVTFSGGEPLLQLDFLLHVMEECRNKKIRTCLDTSGYAPLQDIKKVYPITDLFLFDLKMVDDQKHETYTGVSNRIILENLYFLDDAGVPVNIRLPLVPGMNDHRDDIKQAGELIRSLGNVVRVDLLPYHDIAAQKYIRLNRQNRIIGKKPSGSEWLLHIRKQLEDYDLQVSGGESG